MADRTLSKIVELIGSQDSELRQAAITVSGVIGSAGERVLVKALLDVLNRPDDPGRGAAVVALGRLQVEEALPRLVELVRAAGPELEAAAHAASQLGAKGAKAMSKLMEEAPPSVRSRIAAVLAKGGGASAVVVTAHALLDENPKVVDAAARSLAMEIPSFTPGQRHALAKFLQDTLKDRKAQHSSASDAALLRVLAGLHEAKTEDVFWSRILPPHPVEVRAAALQALGNLEARVGDKQVAPLLQCAGDADFQVVAPALMLLKRAPSGPKTVKHWLKMLEAPDVAARRFAVERLHGVENKQVAEALAAQLTHPDRPLREEALGALRTFAAGREALLDKLLKMPPLDDAWALARALVPEAKSLTKAQRDRLFAEACALHEREDRHAGSLWFLLREHDHKNTFQAILARAQALRQKKKYVEALGFYRLLSQDSQCSDEARFEQAATALKLSNHDLAHEMRANEPALEQFARLLQIPDFDLARHVAKAKWLEPDDLFYLGFHFAEQTHRGKEFGKEVLELVVRRSPTSEIGKQAKRKLKAEALA